LRTLCPIDAYSSCVTLQPSAAVVPPDRIDNELVASLSAEQPVLLVCLRHLGCAFAREALRDLQASRTAIEASGVRLVVAHLEPGELARPLLQASGLDGIDTISDPSARVYEACGLQRGGWRHLFAPRVLWRWISVAVVHRFGAGWTGADVRRLAGVFLVDRGRIVDSYRHRTSADRPDYAAICSRWRRG
jgi:hypothetical protein